MGNFKDFDLDLKKIKANEDMSSTRGISEAITSAITSWAVQSIVQTGNDCFTQKCQTGGCPSTACSPSDMTACRNGDPGVGVRC